MGLTKEYPGKLEWISKRFEMDQNGQKMDQKWT